MEAYLELLRLTSLCHRNCLHHLSRSYKRLLLCLRTSKPGMPYGDPNRPKRTRQRRREELLVIHHMCWSSSQSIYLQHEITITSTTQTPLTILCNLGADLDIYQGCTLVGLGQAIGELGLYLSYSTFHPSLDQKVTRKLRLTSSLPKLITNQNSMKEHSHSPPL